MLEAASGKVDMLISELKDILRGLRPSLLENIGLARLARPVQGNRGLLGHSDQFLFRDVPERFDPEKELAVYRIARRRSTMSSSTPQPRPSTPAGQKGGSSDPDRRRNGQGFDSRTLDDALANSAARFTGLP
jgi:signal transduction histidine kinase